MPIVHVLDYLIPHNEPCFNSLILSLILNEKRMGFIITVRSIIHGLRGCNPSNRFLISLSKRISTLTL